MVGWLMAPNFANREFAAYGPSHWVVLVLFAVGSALLVGFGRRQTQAQARFLGRILSALTAGIYGTVLVYVSITATTIAAAVPLDLTDLATVTAAYALWSQRQWAYALTYYWGLVLSSQAVISPALHGPDFPHYRFLAFFAIHLLVVWAAIYLTWGCGLRPRWRSYGFAVTVTLAWAAATFTFNTVAGTNYGFLNRKPAVASLLDVLGPWPIYLLTAGAAVFVAWALMTWPWQRRADQSSRR
jgi:hypothetical integral membrane protein (TIGR02206 family)